MKKLLFLITFITMVMNVNAQSNDISCILNNDLNPDPVGVYSYATTFDKYSSTTPPMVLNIKFWDLRDDDGSSNTIVTELDALEATANLNIVYNEYNIFLNTVTLNMLMTVLLTIL